MIFTYVSLVENSGRSGSVNPNDSDREPSDAVTLIAEAMSEPSCEKVRVLILSRSKVTNFFTLSFCARLSSASFRNGRYSVYCPIVVSEAESFWIASMSV